MKKNNPTSLFCAIVFSAFLVTSVSAEGFLNQDNGLTPDTNSCLEYRNSNVIQLDVVTTYSEYSAGDPVIISGGIVNQKDAPINNLTVQAVLVQKAEGESSKIVDKFNIIEGIYLDGKETEYISYTYLLPFNAVGGDYEIYFRVIGNDRFTFLNTYNQPYSPNSSFKFSVNSSANEDDYISTNRNEINLSEKPASFLDLFSFDLEKNTIVTFPLINESDVDKKVQVKYGIYFDQEFKSHLLEERIEDVVIPKNSSVVLTQDISIEKDAVYTISIEAEVLTDNDSSIYREKLYEDIRFAVDNRYSVAINFSGIAQYPLLKGIENTFYTCFHEVGLASPEEYKVETALYDFNDNLISKNEYNGVISGNQALSQTVIPKENMSEFYILTSIYDSENNLVDTYKDIYRCDNINSEKCFEAAAESPVRTVVFLLVILFLGVVLLAVIKKNKKNYEI